MKPDPTWYQFLRKHPGRFFQIIMENLASRAGNELMNHPTDRILQVKI